MATGDTENVASGVRGDFYARSLKLAHFSPGYHFNFFLILPSEFCFWDPSNVSDSDTTRTHCVRETGGKDEGCSLLSFAGWRSLLLPDQNPAKAAVCLQQKATKTFTANKKPEISHLACLQTS